MYSASQTPRPGLTGAYTVRPRQNKLCQRQVMRMACGEAKRTEAASKFLETASTLCLGCLLRAAAFPFSALAGELPTHGCQRKTLTILRKCGTMAPQPGRTAAGGGRKAPREESPGSAGQG